MGKTVKYNETAFTCTVRTTKARILRAGYPYAY